jgi:hypothetical protein
LPVDPFGDLHAVGEAQRSHPGVDDHPRPHTSTALALEVDGRGVFHPRPVILDALENRPHDVRRRVDHDGDGDVRQRATL